MKTMINTEWVDCYLIFRSSPFSEKTYITVKGSLESAIEFVKKHFPKAAFFQSEEGFREYDCGNDVVLTIIKDGFIKYSKRASAPPSEMTPRR